MIFGKMTKNLKAHDKTKCPVCREENISVFLEIKQVPIYCNLLLSTRDEALNAPRGDIRLGFCRACGHIYNLLYDPKRIGYTVAYENRLDVSSRFRRYATNLATRLINDYDLHKKTVIDIGCGSGQFLKLLCELGQNHGIGFDPGYAPVPSEAQEPSRVTFVRDVYSESYSHYAADFFCCRHVLEHIHDPVQLLKRLRRTIGNRENTAVFFEVPNVLATLRDLAIWDIIYEHCSYFSRLSLIQLFTLCGFNVRCIAETFEKQYLTIEASPGNPSAYRKHIQPEDFEIMAREVNIFSYRYLRKITACKEQMERIQRVGRRTVIWGAGSKGVTFLNILGIRNQIEYAVDINPLKQGGYIAGTGQEIVSPDFLRNYQPDVVVVMNAVYEAEIRNQTEAMDLDSEIVCV